MMFYKKIKCRNDNTGDEENNYLTGEKQESSSFYINFLHCSKAYDYYCPCLKDAIVPRGSNVDTNKELSI